MTGSTRLFDETTFTELQWKRDPFSSNFYNISLGFRTFSDLLPKDSIEVLEDLHALQCIRDSFGFVCEDTALIMHVDNHQASVQSRLVNLPKLSFLLECCHLAAYISACQLCCKVWRASTIPVSNMLHGFFENLIIYFNSYFSSLKRHTNAKTSLLCR
jgi:hypothetical protein